MHYRWVNKQRADIALLMELEGENPNLTPVPFMEEAFKSLVKENMKKAGKNCQQNPEEGELSLEEGELRRDELYQ